MFIIMIALMIFSQTQNKQKKLQTKLIQISMISDYNKNV